MNPKIRVKLNDNGRIEEWWPVEQVLESVQLDKILDSMLNSIGLMEGLAETFVERINQLEGENIRLAKRIERLEQILAKNGTSEAIELRSQLIGEVNGRYVGQEPEPNGARFQRGQRGWQDCPRCGGPLPPDRWLCAKCASELAEEAALLGAEQVTLAEVEEHYADQDESFANEWDEYKPRQVIA